MARHTETFTVNKSVGRTAEACRMALPFHGWKILNDSGWAFLLKERLDLVGYMISYPTKFAVFLREPEAAGDRDDDAERPESGQTIVELKGAVFGFGPLPKGKLRKKSSELRALIEASVKQR